MITRKLISAAEAHGAVDESNTYHRRALRFRNMVVEAINDAIEKDFKYEVQLDYKDVACRSGLPSPLKYQINNQTFEVELVNQVFQEFKEAGYEVSLDCERFYNRKFVRISW